MILLGHHELRKVEALPATGLPGEQVVFDDTIYTWHEGFGRFEAPLNIRRLLTTADIISDPFSTTASANTCNKTLFSFEVEPNAVYEIAFHLRVNSENMNCSARLALNAPAGSKQAIAVYSPPGRFNSFNMYNMNDSGYEAQFAANFAYFSILPVRGEGILTTGAQGGTVTLKAGVASGGQNAGGVIRYARRSFFTYRRIK